MCVRDAWMIAAPLYRAGVALCMRMTPEVSSALV